MAIRVDELDRRILDIAEREDRGRVVSDDTKILRKGKGSRSTSQICQNGALESDVYTDLLRPSTNGPVPGMVWRLP